MLSLFRRVMVSAFLTAFPAMSQDVAAPSMANVDLETEEGKALERYQQAIDRVEMLGCVLGTMIRLEMKGRETREIVAAMIVRMNSAPPPRMLELCPPDYRKTFEACGEESARLLDRMKTEKMDDEQFDKVFKEYCNRCNEMNAPMMEKYRLRDRSSLFFRMLESKVIGLNREERMKALQRMKDDLIAGKLKIPGENEGMEEETGLIR